MKISWTALSTITASPTIILRWAWNIEHRLVQATNITSRLPEPDPEPPRLDSGGPGFSILPKPNLRWFSITNNGEFGQVATFIYIFHYDIIILLNINLGQYFKIKFLCG